MNAADLADRLPIGCFERRLGQMVPMRYLAVFGAVHLTVVGKERPHRRIGPNDRVEPGKRRSHDGMDDPSQPAQAPARSSIKPEGGQPVVNPLHLGSRCTFRVLDRMQLGHWDFLTSVDVAGRSLPEGSAGR